MQLLIALAANRQGDAGGKEGGAHCETVVQAGFSYVLCCCGVSTGGT